MLQRLQIQNYAIIDELSIDFHPHFNIITGETGAGKSILMGALGLVLGNRADSNVLYDETRKCFVEAVFKLAHPAVALLLQQNELDEESLLTVRREIAANGKSRSFINDTPVTLQVLRQFAGLLVDLHQQFDTLELGEDGFQRSVLDALAGHDELLKQYQDVFTRYTKAGRLLAQLKEQQAQGNKELDYYKFLYEELEEAAFAENEIEQLEEELQLLSNAENIKQVLGAVVYGLKDSEQPLVQQLKTMAQQLQSLRDVHSGISAATERLLSSQIELQDIGDELESINDHLHMDAQRQQEITDRLNIANKLLKKHGVGTTAELLAIFASLEEKLQQVQNLDSSIAAAEKEWKQLQAQVLQLAQTLSGQRRQPVAAFEKQIAALLTQVGMPNAQLKIEISALAEPTPHGIDHIQFLFDANRSGRLEPIAKVASGGELSRLMLSIKSIVAKSMQMPTLIFDEIDTGISGEAARQVGVIMKELARCHQVISITHQPQIAARAEAHYFVYKKEKEGRIKTQVRLLNENERVDAIAHMLSGDQKTEATIKIAEEMVRG